MSNKTYDLLKNIAQIWLPLLSAIIIGLGEIWSLDAMAPIGASLALIDTALGGALAKLSKDYNADSEGVE